MQDVCRHENMIGTPISPKEFLEITDTDYQRLAAHIDLTAWTGKNILLTGGTGFFGAWILALFGWIARQGVADFRVYCVSRDPGRFVLRHPWAGNAQWLHWITGDVRDFAFPDAPIDYVLHAATDTSSTAGDNPGELLDSITEGTRHVLSCARQCNAQRVLLVSSGGVYGAQPSAIHALDETCTSAPSTMDPRSAYGEGKRIMELLGACHAEKTARSVTVARCFAFVGAGLPLDRHFAIGNFIRDALNSDQLTIGGDGSAVRSYLYAADLAVWLLTILTRGQSGRIYNVGSDRAMNMKEIAQTVADTLAPAKPVVVKGQTGASPVGNRYIPSIERARAELGLEVWTSLDLAITNTAVWEGEKN